MSQLDERRIIVAGGARGIGAVVAQAYVEEGARVVIIDVLDDLGERVASACREARPDSALFVRCDVSQRSEVAAAFDVAGDWLGGLDGLVNAAGIERRVAAEEMTDTEWDLMFDVNVRGTMLTNQAAFPHLRAAGGGRILNFGSDAGLRPHIHGAHYSASKGAVMSWSRTLAHEWGRHGITVNAVLPAIRTPMYEEFRSRRSRAELEEHDRRMAAEIPLGGQLGDAKRDLAPVMVFLMSDGAKFITGQLIPVDGGKSFVR